MPIEIGIWRIDNGVAAVDFGPLSIESRLEDILDENVGIASPNWLVIGRQVRTEHGLFIDLLAIDRDANLVVLELKRDKTPRDIIAQLLDYGSWVRELKEDQIAQVFSEYQKRWHKDQSLVSIDEAFQQKFGTTMPDEMNSAHELVVVAASLDPSTERVVRYLADEYGVLINAVFFRIFRDGDREYLSRAWFRDPAEVSAGLGDEFSVLDDAGNSVPITEVSTVASSLRPASDNPETADYLVGVEWIRTADPDKAVDEKGLFGQQNSVARPKSPKWSFTVDRLKTRFGVE